MHAMELRDNSLQWETERQNRIHQAAIEQKKQQMRMENARADAAGVEVMTAGMPAELDEWVEKLHQIPEIRSALIPLDDSVDQEEWSKPFSLAKADVEPWLSFYEGYKQSRLFLESTAAQQADPQVWPTPDFGVRAILELKQVSVKYIAEPPVQINRQVEYFDLEGELKVNRDPMRVRALLKSAAAIHDAELKRAVDKGREMGNLLYDALMGEGHCNLIKAWFKSFNRKPTVEELHLMLTTGRVKAMGERKQPPAEPKPKPVDVRSEAPASTVTQEKRPEPVMPKAPPVRIEPVAAARPLVDAEAEYSAPEAETTDTHISKRKIIWYVVQTVVCCAALAGIAFAF